MSARVKPARVEVRASSIHGKGLFALDAIAKGARIIEYAGERVLAAEGHARYDETAPSTRSSSISRTGAWSTAASVATSRAS